MKEIQKNLDLIFKKAGQFNRYQIIIVILFSLQFICSQFFHNNFSYLTARPFIIFNNTEIRIEPKICNNSFILSEKQIPKTSIILDYKLYCNTFKTYLLNSIYFIGIIIGSCISYNFYDKVGTKLTLSIFIPAQILFQILFQLLNINYLKNILFILYFIIFFLGLSEYIIINILFLYMCDIVNVSDIPIFMAIIVAGRPISFLLGFFFFNFLDFNWKTDLAIMAAIDIIIFILIIKYMVNSPKAALRNNKYVNFIKNILKLSEKNEKKLKKEDFDFLMIYMSNSEKVEYENLFNFNKNPKSLIKKNIIEDIDNFNNFPLINNQKEESQNKKYSEPLL